jgi:hypothetical protein
MEAPGYDPPRILPGAAPLCEPASLRRRPFHIRMPDSMDSWLNGGGRFFNPTPRVSAVPLAPGEYCIVVDDALAHPQGLIDWAATQGFSSPVGFPYPGVILDAPPAVTALVGDYFAQHVRRRLGGRRTLSTTVRLSLVTLSPRALRPVQWQCHRDRLGPVPHDLRLAAMVAYLFRDAGLGGTGFYRSRLSDADTERMIQDADRMDAAQFTASYGLEPGYLSGSNRYFERVAQVPAAWNRMLFYNGDLFHSADIAAPARLSADPRAGRLTLNGFFTCRAAAG